MANWKEVSLDSLAAAKELLAAGRCRSCVSRAYYAFYARVCAELQGLASFPEGREGPNHEDLPYLLRDYLTRLSPRDRWLYSGMAKRLYRHRVYADYRPSQTIDELAAREAVSWTDRFLKAVEASYA